MQHISLSLGYSRACLEVQQTRSFVNRSLVKE